MLGAAKLTDAMVRAAAEGSREDLDQICKTLELQIRLMVLARLSPTPAQLDGVDDVAQEVLLALAEGISRLKNRTVDGLRAFASGIVTRQVAAWIKHPRGRGWTNITSLDKTIATLSRAGPLWEFLSLSGPSPRTRAGQAELIKEIVGALGRLRAEEREIITFAIFDQLKTHEIAHIKGITRAAACMRFKRAMGKLRENLGGKNDVEGADDAPT